MPLNRDGKNGNNNTHFSDFFKLKITICISYKCKHVKVPNLVYFGSPSTILSNTDHTIFIYDKVLSIFLNWKVTPIFALKWSIFRRQKQIPDFCMFGVMVQSSRYTVREFLENLLNRTQFILKKVKAPNTSFAQLLDNVADTCRH